MKSCIRHIIVLLALILLGSGNVYAQTFVIPDPVFKLFLQTNYPAVLDANGDLILANAAGITGDFDATEKNISNIDGLQYFTSLQDIKLAKNNLTTLPDLSAITNLRDLIVDDNQLDSLPPLISLSNLRVLKCDNNRLKKIPPLTNLNNLYRIFCRQNQLTQLPDLTGCTSLYHILCRGNKIDSLPDFSTNTALGVFDCTSNLVQYVHDYSSLLPTLTFRCAKNQLTFEDLWMLARHLSFDSTFDYQPQDSIPVKNNLVFSELDTLSISLGFDDTVTNNIYTWYRNGQILATTFTNKLKIYPAVIQHGGSYYCKITNTGRPSWSSFNLVTEVFKVSITPCMNVDYLNYTLIESDCKKGLTVSLNEFSIINGTPPYKYKLVNTINGDTTFYNSKMLNEIKAGIYDIIVDDNDACAKTIENFISMKEDTKCDLVISPDGDDRNEEYFIDTPGSIKIYDVNGVLVRNMQGPGYWDGSNNHGELVPMGLYAIIVEDKNIANITVVY
jgi:internalin A